MNIGWASQAFRPLANRFGEGSMLNTARSVVAGAQREFAGATSFFQRAGLAQETKDLARVGAALTHFDGTIAFGANGASDAFMAARFLELANNLKGVKSTVFGDGVRNVQAAAQTVATHLNADHGRLADGSLPDVTFAAVGRVREELINTMTTIGTPR